MKELLDQPILHFLDQCEFLESAPLELDFAPPLSPNGSLRGPGTVLLRSVFLDAPFSHRLAALFSHRLVAAPFSRRLVASVVTSVGTSIGTSAGTTSINWFAKLS